MEDREAYILFYYKETAWGNSYQLLLFSSKIINNKINNNN